MKISQGAEILSNAPVFHLRIQVNGVCFGTYIQALHTIKYVLYSEHVDRMQYDRSLNSFYYAREKTRTST